jgi:hypothetical protein
MFNAYSSARSLSLMIAIARAGIAKQKLYYPIMYLESLS